MCADAIPDFLHRVSQSLRASVSFQRAMELAALDTPGALGEEMRDVCRMVSSGLDVVEGLRTLSTRLGDREIVVFVESVAALKAAGCGMADMFERIADISTARIEVREKVEMQSAQNRYQAIMLGIMPWLMFGALAAVQYDYVSPLVNTRLGTVILFIAFVMQMLGFVWLRILFREVR